MRVSNKIVDNPTLESVKDKTIEIINKQPGGMDKNPTEDPEMKD